MTREEFVRGYLLLTTQPWGKTYRTGPLRLDGEPTPAEIQLEFYYQKLEAYPVEAWVKTCEIMATGEAWPSIDALKTTMKQVKVTQRALPAPEPQYVGLRDALAERPDLIKKIERLLT